jgi:CDP-4-dehydro-6-deoxyglucose reductase, E1
LTENNDFLTNSSLDVTQKGKQLRGEILELISEYHEISHNNNKFVPGKTIVPVSGKVYDDYDLQMLASSSLDFWLTSGRFNDKFEKELGNFLKMSYVLTTNSGSSANLLALTALTSDKFEDSALQKGDEVISVAAGFPTTVNPILQNNLVPVFVDVEIPTYVIDPELIEKAITDKTKAIMIAHTLGNCFDVEKISKIAKENNLWLIEDCCDALGSTFNNQHVGSFGDVSTCSFYPAHHITMGEGGAVFTNNSQINRIVESLRDWGRDCFCAPGKNNTCGKRFEWKLGELPEGYDHKYTYSNLGYNLKITDMQAAVGLAQIKHLPEFIKKRKENFIFLKNALSELSEYMILPEATKNSEPSWFGFPITIKENKLYKKDELILFLSKSLIDTRPLFAGNITKQPYIKNYQYKIVSSLEKTDLIMNNSFWIGVYPGITKEMLEYVVTKFKEFFNK